MSRVFRSVMFSAACAWIAPALASGSNATEQQLRVQPGATSRLAGVERVTVKPATQQRMQAAVSVSTADLTKRYGPLQARVNLRTLPVGSPMLTFSGESLLNLQKQSNAIYGYQYCYSIKNTGNAKSAPANVHVEAEANNNPSLELTLMEGSSGDLKVPGLEPNEDASVCGTMFFDQLIHADSVPLMDQPRFFATITGELNQGKTVMLYPGIVRTSKSGSASSPPSGPFLGFQPVYAKAAYGLQTNVIDACFSINNLGSAASPAAAVKVSANVGGVMTSGSVPVPALAPNTHMYQACGPIAVKGLKGDKLANLTYQDDFALTGAIVGTVNNGSSILFDLRYNETYADIGN